MTRAGRGTCASLPGGARPPSAAAGLRRSTPSCWWTRHGPSCRPTPARRPRDASCRPRGGGGGGDVPPRSAGPCREGAGPRPSKSGGMPPPELAGSVVERGQDGMGLLQVYAPVVELHADPRPRHRDGQGDRRPRVERREPVDQVRADIVCDLLVDGRTDAVPPPRRAIRASVVVTVPVLSPPHDDAAASAADPLPVVEGIGPIPVSRARELSGGDGSWMRVLTHPETGMVLSVGREPDIGHRCCCGS